MTKEKEFIRGGEKVNVESWKKLDYKKMQDWRTYGSGHFSLLDYYKSHLDAAIKYKR